MTAEPSSKTTHGAINWGSKSASANNGSTAKDLEVGSIGPRVKRICISLNRSSKGWHYLEPHTRLWCPLQLERNPPTTFAEQQRETGVNKRSNNAPGHMASKLTVDPRVDVGQRHSDAPHSAVFFAASEAVFLIVVEVEQMAGPWDALWSRVTGGHSMAAQVSPASRGRFLGSEFCGSTAEL
ncbi:uncharacterized protein NECHADRAFT_83425 [Fusarium vanettenii 77-13-4]|uniref:Uncharacterized protein n=1 Tax=Fusarium vanettenii (strain ATCC MYA-4622 / CBS 123669 / FGSC 9596 / NRRL 45880 / 77-13-4) TaxID=660122 RepID=C7Z3Z7_FUSV7|nr:uncharacterized protein NECHADRAFT_83425 [Fusarium vanettenii 77-13-4]EEU41393.1 predicted protein [Fusarium vanettenii 77-13-4]